MENRNELGLTCFTTEFIDIKILSSVLAMKPFLSNYTDAFSQASLQLKQVKSEEYMGFSIPFAKIEDALQHLQKKHSGYWKISFERFIFQIRRGTYA